MSVEREVIKNVIEKVLETKRRGGGERMFGVKTCKEYMGSYKVCNNLLQ